MRLEGQAKLGYYPTPDTTLRHILTWLSINEEGLLPKVDLRRRYLDPCCGQGEALAAIAHAHGPAETYGIELSDVRAREAAHVLTHTLNTGYEYAVITDETFSLILLNPPYDGEEVTGGGARMEETFLLTTTSRLVPSGVLIYLIPHARINEKIARHIAGWYRDVRCFKLPEEEYAIFKQVVIFGIRRADYQPPTGNATGAVQTWAKGMELTGEAVKTASALPHLQAGGGQYRIPECGLKGKHGAGFRFQYVLVSEDDILREAVDAACRVQAGREWRDLVPATSPKVITPVMTPKKGHIGPQLLSGLLGTNCVSTLGDGQPLLLKGHIHKRRYQVESDEEEVVEDDLPDEDDAERRRFKRVEVKEKFEAVLMTLAHSGQMERQTDPAAIGRILEQYVKPLADVVQTRNVPRYDMKPEAWEWELFSSLSKGRYLPGRNETGLTDFQRHLAIAMGRLCLANGAGLVNAEMGAGKSTILLGTAEYLHHIARTRVHTKRCTPYPALIVGPGIVTGQENWPKEIREVIPTAYSRLVTVGAKPAPKPAKIGQWLERLGITIDDEAAFAIQGKRAEATVRHALATIQKRAKKQNVAVSEAEQFALAASFKRAATHPPKRRKGADAPNLLDGRIGGYAWLGLDVARDEAHKRELAGEYSLAQFVTDYTAGRLPEKSFAVMSFETAKLGAGRIPAMSSRHLRITRRDEATDETWTEVVRICACPHCGAVVSEKYDPETGEPLKPIEVGEAEKWVGTKRRFCKAPLRYFNRQTQRHEPGQWVFDYERGRKVVRTHDGDGVPFVCGRPLYEETALRREAAARFALKKLKGTFGLLAVDEIHKCKAKGTGVGWVLQALTNVCRYTVGLTGTLFGGYSTSIFWLLYRLSGEVRREFGFDDEQRWTAKYGLFKSVFYVDKDDDLTEDGTYTGTKHFETVSELPGISPAIVGLGLEHATFSSLKDVGLPLPAYAEQIVRLPLTDKMQEQISEADGSQTTPPTGLLAWALAEQKQEDGKGAVSVWLNTALNRPDAMFRGEQVWFNRRLSGRGKYAIRRRELVTEFGAVGDDGLLPKEEWLAKTCQTQQVQGRRTLVYVRQTGERDIQPRLVEILRAHGLRPTILKPSLAPARRASWIKQNAEKMDVLITNSRLVEVGLNLTTFSTGIFFEAEWSLYILWQALRRLYRPGAPRPVEMYFPVYEGTLEEGALDLLGAKMKAAQIFYGDEVGGALIEDEDESDLLHSLLRRALGDVAVGRADGLFAPANAQVNDMAVTDSPIGSLTALSPRLVTMMDLWTQKQSILRRAKRKTGPTQNQMTLF